MKTTKIPGFVSITKKGIFFRFLVLSMVLVIAACTKDQSDPGTLGKATLSVRMTDAPANYDAVFIDIAGVEVKGENGSTIALNTNAGIYNLLDFSNGLDTLLASGDLEAGTISQIRLILGSNNSVVIDSVSYPLSTPGASESGLKLQVHKSFEPGVVYTILLDFDAAQSIVAKGNGGFLLKPVIRTIEMALSGSVFGSVAPVLPNSTITASSSALTASTVVNEEGKFVIRGLPAGIYDVTVTPDLPFLPVTITGVTVTVGAATNLGLIPL